LDAQRDAGEAYVAAQKHEGWISLADRYDDAGFTGANMERPALKRLFKDIEAGQVDVVIAYKIDRVSRSLLDFARMMQTFEQYHVSLVSVTQAFNTTQSMGRLTLNILLSFAQFEREIIGERTRDKIAAARRRGRWMGGRPILGFDLVGAAGAAKLVPNADEAQRVRDIYALYLEHGRLIPVVRELERRGWRTKSWVTRKGQRVGGRPFDKNYLFKLLTNRGYLGQVTHHDEFYPGEHAAIVDEALWQQVNQQLAANGRTGGSHIRNKHGALLKGLLFCAPCNRAMTFSYSVKNARCLYKYYTCGTAAGRGWDACPTKSVPATQIEQFVVERIRGIGRDPALILAALEQTCGVQRTQRAALEREQREVEREVARLHAAMRKATSKPEGRGPGAAQLAEWQDALRRQEQRAAELAGEFAALGDDSLTREELTAALAEFDGAWGAMTPNEQCRLLRLVVRRVDYDGAAGHVTIAFHPTGLRTLGQPASEEVTV
jgi:site-specific DNA recombinase